MENITLNSHEKVKLTPSVRAQQVFGSEVKHQLGTKTVAVCCFVGLAKNSRLMIREHDALVSDICTLVSFFSRMGD